MKALATLLQAASAAGWTGAAADDLAAAIETNIVASVPIRLRQALGSDEARQRARVLAWERCRRLAVDPPADGLEWGYLANHVRWKLADAVRAEALRRQRHPVIESVPEGIATDLREPFGERLERLSQELSSAGMTPSVAGQLLRAAVEGPRFERRRIAARVEEAGASHGQAEALAWLLRGGPGFESVIVRLARGDSPLHVFADPDVRRRITAVGRSFEDIQDSGHHSATVSHVHRAA
jgi:hypothetical protein